MEYAIGLIVYILFTLGVIKFKKEIPPYSLLFLFMVYCFFAYGVASVYFQVFPEASFLTRSYYQIDFIRDVLPQMPKAFNVFLLGYICFIVGYLLIGNRRINIKFNTTIQYNIIYIIISFLIANWFSFLFRLHYKAAVAKVMSATHNFANYLWYSFHYFSLILLAILLYLALNKKKNFWFWIAIICGLNFGVSQIFLGWKSGIVWFGLILFHTFFYMKYKSGMIKPKITLIISILIVAVFVFLSFRIVPIYRSKIIFWKEEKNIEMIIQVVKPLFFKPVSIDEIKYYSQIAMNRLTGINSLSPIVAHSKAEDEPQLSVLSNIFQRNSYHPEIFYGQYVIKDAGVTAESGPTTHAPTGIGVFYMYGGAIGVAIGLFIIGGLARLFETTVQHFQDQSTEFGALNTIVYAVIFPAVVFEGTVFFFLKRHFGSLMLVFLLFRFVLVSWQRRKIAFL